ncbi:MAG: HU family DNA-binding protein [Christensenellales bacterium]|jgi:nucleoid DNA-binding protein
MATVNKKKLIDEVAKATGLTAKDAKAAVEATLGTIANGLKDGKATQLLGFGTFSVKDVPARIGRNPRTGEPMQVAAKKKIVFKAGRALLDDLNK